MIVSGIGNGVAKAALERSRWFERRFLRVLLPVHSASISAALQRRTS
jgi:hypothetical protein